MRMSGLGNAALGIAVHIDTIACFNECRCLHVYLSVCVALKPYGSSQA